MVKKEPLGAGFSPPAVIGMPVRATGTSVQPDRWGAAFLITEQRLNDFKVFIFCFTSVFCALFYK